MAASLAAVLGGFPVLAVAQEAPSASEPAGDLPPVEVIQQQPTPAPAAQKKAAPKKKTAVSPAPLPPSQVASEPPPATSNPIYGARNSGPAAQRAANGATSPINPTSIVPSNLENYTGSATIVGQDALQEDRPATNNEVFTRVPGVIVVNDDGNGHHGGLGIRGSAPRRARKLLVMEDGHANNLALWLDPSVHFTYPIERIESFEVIRGTTLVHGPNNNFGVINARNLSPFGINETVISSAIGWTRNRGGCYAERDEDTGEREYDEDVCKSGSTDESYRWHVHTRQMVDNVGVVMSYTGADIQGSWDSEQLRFHDFYGAIGWKGTDQDLTVSVSHTRQRDLYDESNLEGEESETEEEFLGLVEQDFFRTGHCKTCFAPGAVFNNYNGDIWRGQIVHNNYVDDNTTVTTRVYAQEHRRDRYQIATLGDDPSDPGADEGTPASFGEGEFEDAVFFGNGSMYGRLRTFRHLGAETRAEFANLPFVGGMSQTIQTGIRYEYQDMTNRNFLGAVGDALEDGDDTGLTIFERNLRANTASAFVQTDIKVASDLHVVPGVRFEWYRIKRDSFVTSEEEGEAEEAEEISEEAEDQCEALGIDEDECYVIEGIQRGAFQESTSSFEALPGISTSYTGLYRTTLFAGYHRGLSTGVLRNEDFPAPDEIGDNFQVGFRSKAFTGLDFQVVGFYQFLQDFQYGATFTTAEDKTYGRADEVEIRGVELYGRLDSKPLVGGPLNFFGEGNYSYSNGIFTKGVVEVEEDGATETVNLSGKHLPEVPFNLAALTVGVEDRAAVWPWNASVTWTYRGEFFTDEFNTAYGGNEEGEVGLVPSVWLLSARFNLAIGDTGASMYVAGTNLLDEFYITDREDGLKPGLGRTVWTGFQYKF